MCFPRRVAAILSSALALSERWEAQEITPHGLRVLRGRLRAQMSRLLRGRFTNATNRRLAKHLRRYEQALFVFLDRDDVEACNWLGEHAMRGAVANRKCCGGGNRTTLGAQTQAVLMSTLRTCHQKSLSPRQVIAEILRAPVPQPHQLLVG